MNYSISYLSYNNKDQELLFRSKQILNGFFKSENYTLNQDDGKLIFIASGGSEHHSIELTKEHHNIIILCHRENNSFAAAIEISAFVRSQNKRASIIDVNAPNAFSEFEAILNVNLAMENLAGQKTALIGEISDWLIISDVNSKFIKDKLGIELIKIPWSNLDDFREKEPA